MNPVQRDFMRRLNEYRTIYNKGGGTENERLMAHIIRGVDRPGRVRRYLSTEQTPSIDGFIDFAHAEREHRI